jgi:hypothetical protein
MSCTDVQTIQAGNGTKTQFSFDFPYIFKSEIHVYFWNATTKEYDEKLTTDATYPWRITDANPTIVEFTGTAPPAPATPVDPGETTVDNVKIRRITQVDDIRALFNPGSAIRSDDLNKNFEQLRYAIQESNCQGIPDDVDQYLKDYYWDRFDNTLYSADTWRSDDATIATTASLDQRFQDEVNETFTKAELAAASDVMPDNDDAVPTTGTVKDFVDHVVETDILVDGTGLNKTGSGGQVTLGISADSVDFDRIKDADKIQLADQIADYDNAGSNDKVFTSSAAVRRFENYVQTSTPSNSGIGKGAVWVDNDDDLTLSVWDGSAWLGITSGGTFTNQPKVVYVDASSGNDANDGHRISRPKATIKAAINQINLDSTYGDGSVVVVAAGVYQEAAPIQIQKKNVSIVGQALRSCIVHPTPATETNVLFELNSGSFIQNLTLTGMKAGTGTGNTLDPDLPTVQGWNFAFYNGATITKSPYIQNCTNFSDSEIDNSDLNANNPAGGAGGDTDSAPTGGGMLVNGSAVASDSPLRSMVADSYTHVGLNGPGILVTNNGYCQATSSYAFFNKYHIKCLNGGQANLAASTTDFGAEALVADGKSSTAIFTSNVDGAATDGDISFNINEPVADSSWHGSATRPQSNMLVEVNGNIYPVLSAVANTDSEGGAGWTVTINRPNASNRSINDGIDGNISDDASVSFYLRSMIASSGHTMEYVGSGTDYSALPENGGVPDDTKQIVESNNGKIWTATTDHNGKFSVGDFFQVDQRTGFVSFSAGSVAFDLATDSTPQLGGDLDTNNFDINLAAGTEGAPSLTFSGDEDTGIYSPGANQVALATNGTGRLFIDSSGNVGVGTSSPAHAVHIAGATTPELIVEDTTNNVKAVVGADNTVGRIGTDTNHALTLRTNDTEQMRIDSSGRLGVGTSSPSSLMHLQTTSENVVLQMLENNGSTVYGASLDAFNSSGGNIRLRLHDSGGTYQERLRITSTGKVGIGTTSPSTTLHCSSGSVDIATFQRSSAGADAALMIVDSANTGAYINTGGGANVIFATRSAGTNSERLRITSDGKLGVGTSSPTENLTIYGASARLAVTGGNGSSAILLGNQDSVGANNPSVIDAANGNLYFGGGSSWSGGGTFDYTMTLTDGGNVGIGTTSPSLKLSVDGDTWFGNGAGVEIGRLFNDAGVFHLRGSSNVTGLALGTNGSEKVRIDSSGRLGVGNSAPVVPVDIYSAANGLPATTGTTQTHGSLRINSSSTTGCIDMGPNSSNPWIQATDRTDLSQTYNLLLNPNGGNVGIGATSPGNPLAISQTVSTTFGNAGTYLGLGETENTSGQKVLIGFGYKAAASNEYPAVIGYTATSNAGNQNGAIVFGTRSVTTNTAPTERARIDSSGRLLVGKTSGLGESKFQIQGTTSSVNEWGGLFLSRGLSNTAINTNFYLGELLFGGSEGSVGAIIRATADDSWAASDYPGRLIFFTTPDSASDPVERLRIDSEGRTMLGVSSAGLAKLCVETSFGGTPSNASATRHALSLHSTQTAGANIGPSIYFRGKTNNTTADYGFAAIQGCKGSTTAGDYTGHIRFLTQNSGGASALSETCRMTRDGLTFHGNTAAANALDDYEEGTWTPTIYSGGFTLQSVTTAKYTKIGNLVNVFCYVDISGTGTATTMSFDGLPYDVANQHFTSGGIDTEKQGVKGMFSRISGSTSRIEFFYPSESSSERVEMQGTDFAAGYFIFNITYQAA